MTFCKFLEAGGCKIITDANLFNETLSSFISYSFTTTFITTYDIESFKICKAQTLTYVCFTKILWFINSIVLFNFLES